MIDGIVSVTNYEHPSPHHHLLFIPAIVNNQQMHAMIDTGASYSFINADCLHRCSNSIFLDRIQKRFMLADGQNTLHATGTVRLKIEIGGITTTTEAFVARSLCTNLILGMNYLSRYDLEIRTKSRTLRLHVNGKQLSIPLIDSLKKNDRETKTTSPTSSFSKQILHYPVHDRPPSEISMSQQTIDAPNSTLLSSLPSNFLEHRNESTRSTSDNGPLDSVRQQIDNLIKHIDDNEQHRSLKTLLYQFERTFDTSQYTTARTPVTHIIETHPHTPPVSRCYPSNPKMITEMRQIIDSLLKSGLIRASKSPYAAAALLTKKKDQTWRLVIDYKKLNATCERLSVFRFDERKPEVENHTSR